MSRLRKMKKKATLEDLNNMNMPMGLLNEILLSKGEDEVVENVKYRRMMNSNMKFVVEMWEMSDKTYSVFSGEFQGAWTLDNIEFNGNFSDDTEAELYIQTKLQSSADTQENVVGSVKRLNNFKKKLASGKGPDYDTVIDGFLKEVEILPFLPNNSDLI